MTLLIITILVFLVTSGLLVSAAYFLIQAPAERREMRIRLASIQESAVAGGGGIESQIVRNEILSEIPWLNRMLLELPFLSRIQLFLTQAAVSTPLGTVLLATFCLGIAGALAGLIVGMPPLFTLLLTLGAACLPFVAIQVRRQRRMKHFEELFPDAIDMLARAVRAGHAFTTGFSLIASEMPEPVAGEFRTTFEQQNLGLPLSEALRNMEVRVPLPDVRIFVAALAVQRDSGGNLGEILDSLAAVIRERFKILRQVQVFTAEGRLSLYILTAMPPVAGVMMYFVNPEYMMRLFTDPLGHTALGTAFVMQVLGYVVIRKLIRIKV